MAAGPPGTARAARAGAPRPCCHPRRTAARPGRDRRTRRPVRQRVAAPRDTGGAHWQRAGRGDRRRRGTPGAGELRHTGDRGPTGCGGGDADAPTGKRRADGSGRGRRDRCERYGDRSRPERYGDRSRSERHARSGRGRHRRHHGGRARDRRQPCDAWGARRRGHRPAHRGPYRHGCRHRHRHRSRLPYGDAAADGDRLGNPAVAGRRVSRGRRAA